MRVFGCTWKINFPENIFSWPCVLMALTHKWFEVKIFNSNHFRTHAQRQREREREEEERAQSSNRAPVRQPQQRTPQTELQSNDPHFTDLIDRSIASIKQRSTPTPLDLTSATWSHLCIHRTISPLSLPFSLNLTEFDEFFPWILFLLCFCIEEWYYIFVWQLRKCEKMCATSRKCVFYGIFKNTTKYQKIFFKTFFEMQPNTWKYFYFPKIAFLENKYFQENILHEPNTT